MTATATLGEIAAANATEREDAEKKRAERRARKSADRQRQRERQREQHRVASEAEAARIEIEAARKERLDEDLAPAVMRNAVTRKIDVDGEMVERMIVGPRVQIIDGRPVRAFGPMADPINRLRLKERQQKAALALQADWRDVGAGLGAGAMDYLRTTGGGGGAVPPGHEAMLGQIAARARLEGALTHLGAFTPAVVRVVLDGIPLSCWAVEAARTVEDARGWIVAALERLAGFYFPPRQTFDGDIVILAFGPSRESYSTDVNAAEAE